MILTCPQCETKFTVPDGAITAEGRKVRCAQCKHEWHQLPVEDEKPVEKTPEVAPEAVSDDKGEKQKPLDKIKSMITWLKGEITEGIKPFAIGLSVVLVVFALIQLMSSHLIVGQGLAFHNVAVTRDGETLKISGEVVNSMNEKRGVPKIQITMLYEDVEGDSVLVAPTTDVLHSGETLEFMHEVVGHDIHVTDLNVKFIIEDTHKAEHKVEAIDTHQEPEIEDDDYHGED